MGRVRRTDGRPAGRPYAVAKGASVSAKRCSSILRSAAVSTAKRAHSAVDLEIGEQPGRILVEMQPALAAAIEGAALAFFQLRMAAAHLLQEAIEPIQRGLAGVAHQ